MSMVSYNITELVDRFDTRSPAEGETGVTGKLSSFLGDDLLLDVLAHALAAEGQKVARLQGHPHGDIAVFDAAGAERPGFRDLDAWLIAGRHLVAVECKQWTSSSPRYVSVPGDDNRVAEYARREWEKSVEWHFTRGRWDEVNKVALPLKPPDAAEKASWPDIRRVLAVWTPVSQDGQYAFSSIQTQTLSGTSWKPATVEAFSASLYLRNLRHRGETHLTTTFPQVERLLEGLHALFRS